MQKEISYKGSIDYAATLTSLEAGDYVVIPSSSNDISNIRTIVTKFCQRAEAEGKKFSVHKTINGARVDRTE